MEVSYTPDKRFLADGDRDAAPSPKIFSSKNFFVVLSEKKNVTSVSGSIPPYFQFGSPRNWHVDGDR